ncbi:MAG: hypothetical protein A2Y38_15190 [Spirochaetes bacterium GWB1_59_5]|nr:MAG: hypothetical protein A2Y38_15190 [Spirochaetes bacterium GWB1_59_5]
MNWWDWILVVVVIVAVPVAIAGIIKNGDLEYRLSRLRSDYDKLFSEYNHLVAKMAARAGNGKKVSGVVAGEKQGIA